MLDDSCILGPSAAFHCFAQNRRPTFSLPFVAPTPDLHLSLFIISLFLYPQLHHPHLTGNPHENHPGSPLVSARRKRGRPQGTD